MRCRVVVVHRSVARKIRQSEIAFDKIIFYYKDCLRNIRLHGEKATIKLWKRLQHIPVEGFEVLNPFSLVLTSVSRVAGLSSFLSLLKKKYYSGCSG